jgi:hypothetical protein
MDLCGLHIEQHQMCRISHAVSAARKEVSGSMRVRRESGKGAGDASGAGGRDGGGGGGGGLGQWVDVLAAQRPPTHVTLRDPTP